MKIYKYWSVLPVEYPEDGTVVNFRAGSDISEADARRICEEKREKYERCRSDESYRQELSEKPRDDSYDVAPCEEYLAELPGRNVLTRNRQGHVILNSEDHCIIDIDTPWYRWQRVELPKLDIDWGFLRPFFFLGVLYGVWLWQRDMLLALGCAVVSSLLMILVCKVMGKRDAQPVEDAGETIAAQKEAWYRDLLAKASSPCYSGMTFRFYSTAGGYRVFVLGRQIEPGSQEMKDLFEAFDADPLYTTLCCKQKSYRARLSPKCRRIHLRGVSRFPYPRRPEEEAEHARWVEAYNEKSSKYAVCRYETQIGDAAPSDIVQRHDKATRAREPLPLA